jgi:hypothetical protein
MSVILYLLRLITVDAAGWQCLDFNTCWLSTGPLRLLVNDMASTLATTAFLGDSRPRIIATYAVYVLIAIPGAASSRESITHWELSMLF